MVRHILRRGAPARIREDYAIGTGQWRALPFGMECACPPAASVISATYDFGVDEPQLRVGGPTA